MIIQKNASILRHVHTEVHRDKGASCLRLTLKWFWRMMRWRWPLGWRTHRKLGEKYMDFLVLPFEIFFWLQKSSWIYSLSIQQDFFFQLTVFSWILLEADTEPRIWVCVVISQQASCLVRNAKRSSSEKRKMIRTLVRNLDLHTERKSFREEISEYKITTFIFLARLI